jgi:hypothetical protein
MARVRFRAAAIGVLAAALSLVGCGGPAAVDLRNAPPPIRLTIGEFHVSPQNILVRPGTLRLLVLNAGALDHQLAIGQNAMILDRTSWLKPGQSQQLSLQVTRGDYDLFDPTENNDAAGISGSVDVR